MKPVTFAQSFALSPWPARITGKEDWKKKVRDVSAVLAEYDQNWYRPLLKRWESFRTSLDRKPELKDAVAFFRSVDREINDEVERNSAIYRSRISQYLLSSGEELFAGDLNIATGILNVVMDSELERILEESSAESLVELGCGNGKHVFRSLHLQNLRTARGGDISPAATLMSTQVAKDVQAEADFFEFNYYEPKTYETITAGLDKYIVCTCHSIEQIPEVSGHLVESILSLKHKPEFVVHFEPVIFHDGSEFDRRCQQYAELNNYNQDLLPTLKVAEERGRIRVVRVLSRVWGVSAFNPTSIIVWQPLS